MKKPSTLPGLSGCQSQSNRLADVDVPIKYEEASVVFGMLQTPDRLVALTVEVHRQWSSAVEAMSCSGDILLSRMSYQDSLTCSVRASYRY